jgi:hypothetical protein
MLALWAIRTRRVWTTLSAMAIGATALLAPIPATAHFLLDSPTNWVTMSPDNVGGGGLPEKMAPCGNEPATAPAGILTHAVSNFVANADGSVNITITLHESTYHPGHYRVALVNAPTSSQTPGATTLPADPTVTPSSTDSCASAAIETVPAGTILSDGVIADGVLTHTSPFSPAEQTITINNLHLPFTCTDCTLQVVEFMSSHGAPCFYHHCADIKILPAGADGGGTSSSSGSGGSDASVSTDASHTSNDAAASSGSGGSSSSSGAGGSSGAAGSTSSSSSGASGGSSGTSGSSGSSGAAGGSSGVGGSSSGTASNAGSDASTGPGAPSSAGCSCLIARGDGIPAVAGLAGFVALAAMRRRRRRG